MTKYIPGELYRTTRSGPNLNTPKLENTENVFYIVPDHNKGRDGGAPYEPYDKMVIPTGTPILFLGIGVKDMEELDYVFYHKGEFIFLEEFQLKDLGFELASLT